MAGGSIGAVLSQAGWQVVKRRLQLGQIDVPNGSRASILMQLPGRSLLATDLYELSVQRDELILSYATIAEIHHPHYMSLDQLRTLPVLQSARGDGSNLLRLAEQIAAEIASNPN
jgi:hypothetical protein